MKTKTLKHIAEIVRRVPLFKDPVDAIVLQYRMRNYDKANRTFWTERRTSATDKHLSIYWDSETNLNRLELIKSTCDLLQEGRADEGYSILEFGSHVGINLKMISEAMLKKNIQVDLYAVEPNEEAFRFMTSKLRLAKGLNGDDLDFVKDASFPGKRISVGLVNAVLYSLSYSSACRVLEKMSKVCDALVIGDEMVNFDGTGPVFFCAQDYESKEYSSLAHPFRKMLLKLGFKSENLTRCDVPQPKKAITGIIVAKR